MTIPVPASRPPGVGTGPLQIGQPVGGPLLGGFAASLAHLLGAQLSMIACQVIGKNEEPLAAGTAYYRYRFYAHPNARSVVVSVIPFGYRAGSSGQFKVTGAETVETLTVEQDGGAIVTLAELVAQDTFWSFPVTPDAVNDIVIECTDATPHTIAIWETPADLLSGTQPHVDRSVGDASRYITDDTSASNPRGFKQILQAIDLAKINSRRHVVMGSWPGGYTENSGAFVYLVGSATAGDGLRIYSRLVNPTGAPAVTETPVRMYFYVDTGGAGTHTIRVITGAAASPYDLAGINAAVAGWVGPLDVAVLDGTDTMKIQAQRTAGAAGNTLEVSSICGWERFT